MTTIVTKIDIDRVRCTLDELGIENVTDEDICVLIERLREYQVMNAAEKETLGQNGVQV